LSGPEEEANNSATAPSNEDVNKHFA